MRVAVISDIHSNQPALEAVYHDMFSLPDPVDQIWFLGDLLGMGPHPIQTYHKLNSLIKPQYWLSGNHDYAVAGDEKCYNVMNGRSKVVVNIHKETLPENIIENISTRPSFLSEVKLNDKVTATLAHGFPRKKPSETLRTYDYDRAPYSVEGQSRPILDNERTEFANTAIWLIGHSHRQTGWTWSASEQSWNYLIKDVGQTLAGENKPILPEIGANGEISDHPTGEYQIKDTDLIILNPGSVGFPRDGICTKGGEYHLAKYLILEVDDNNLWVQYRRVAYSGQRVRDTWQDSFYPEDIEKYLNC